MWECDKKMCRMSRCTLSGHAKPRHPASMAITSLMTYEIAYCCDTWPPTDDPRMLTFTRGMHFLVKLWKTSSGTWIHVTRGSMQQRRDHLGNGRLREAVRAASARRSFRQFHHNPPGWPESNGFPRESAPRECHFLYNACLFAEQRENSIPPGRGSVVVDRNHQDQKMFARIFRRQRMQQIFRQLPFSP